MASVKVENIIKGAGTHFAHGCWLCAAPQGSCLTLHVIVCWKVFTGNPANCGHIIHIPMNGMVCPCR